MFEQIVLSYRHKILEKLSKPFTVRGSKEYYTNKKLAEVEHELAYTLKSKNILTLNNHAMGERLAKLEAYTAYVLQLQVVKFRITQKAEVYEKEINKQKGLLLSLEHEIERLKTALNIANIENNKRWWKPLKNT